VEAYVEILPSIIALRLCNKFGKGPECHIRKLPTELFDVIEQLVVKPERKKRLVLWSQLLRCYTGQCNPENGHPLTGEENMCYSDRDCVLEDCEYQFHEFYTVAHQEICLDNQREFEKEIRYGSLWGRQKLLNAHFGIGIWISPTRSDIDGWTALAYLTLPNDPSRTETWAESVRGSNFQSNDTGYGMPVHMGATPSHASLQRFPEALKKFDLEIFVQSSQKSAQVLSTGDRKVEESKAVDETAGSGKVIEKVGTWPQLTLLVYSGPEPDQDDW
jgi:hypothetical protein